MNTERQAAADARAAFVDRLRAALPEAMRALPQWLLWRFEIDPKRPKPAKVPYYVNGRRRVGRQGDEADRHRLATFDVAIERLHKATQFDGLGFAFLPGDGLVGIDIDGAIDPVSGETSPMCTTLIEACGSYTERSPSGKGVHIITRGATNIFKSNDIGLEVFCGAQFFTCSGDRFPGTPPQVAPLDELVLAYMRELVDEAQAVAQREKPPAPAPAAAPARPPAAQGAQGANSGADDFKRVNDAALQALGAWVRELFPKARPHASTGGFRVTSKDLGRQLEEDLSITPEGIVDFGEEQGYTAIDLVMKWSPASTPKEALHWLAGRIGVQIGKRPLRLVQLPAVQAAPAADERPEPPDADPDGGAAAVVPIRGRQRRKRPPPDDGGGGVSRRLLENFRLIYGTDQVWDGEKRKPMAVKNLRLIFGAPLVNQWLAHPDRQLLDPEQMLFEPGVELAEGCVNLFDGFATEPMRCTAAEVKPMLDLAHHLCSLSAPTPEGVAAVFHQLMCWLALPLQRPGVKMRFSLVFHGPQGTGKNLFFDCYRSIFGKYGRMVGQSELEDKFNGYLSAKLFIVANEVFTRQELFHGKNKLKAVITDDQIAIRGMHMEVRWESNHCNLAFLSNELMPVALEKDDRRHLVVYTPAAEDRDLYLRMADFIAGGGAAKFMDFLLRYDIDDFHEHTLPLMTRAKETLIELGLKPAERFVNEWLDGYLPLPVHVCGAEQLYRVFRRWCEQNGEKYPPAQSMFTESVRRHVFERVERDGAGAKLATRLNYKVIALKHDTGPRKSMRCWLPRGAGPLPGVSEGEWAADCVNSFEAAAARFGRSQHEVDE